MAAGVLSEPGTEYGPCAGACAHRDCAELRKVAAAACHWCDEPIGYDKRYYRVDENVVEGGQVVGKTDGYVHAVCEETAAES